MQTHVFSFYLDAWRHCVKQGLSQENIKRVNWDKWGVYS